jgi:hypothetical protein
MVQRAGWSIQESNESAHANSAKTPSPTAVRTAIFTGHQDSLQLQPAPFQPPNAPLTAPQSTQSLMPTENIPSPLPRSLNEKPQESIPARPDTRDDSPSDKPAQDADAWQDNTKEDQDKDDAPNPFLESLPPNPFPGKPRNGTKGSDNGKERSPPRGAKVVDSNCQNVRDRALADDIRKVRLDVSPGFAVGPTDKTKMDEKKQAFVEKAPSRTWYDLQGEFLVEGRLVDLVKDQVVLETSSGARNAVLLRELSEPDLVYVSESWGLPVTCSLGDFLFPARDFVPATVAYKASGLCHKPLYFEEVQLERYGHEIGPVMQPVVSTAHFFTNIAVLPYKMGIHPMNECQYALGYYRPGNCAPWTMGPVPISLRGALFQAGAVAGVAAAIP